MVRETRTMAAEIEFYKLETNASLSSVRQARQRRGRVEIKKPPAGSSLNKTLNEKTTKLILIIIFQLHPG